jgi:hypothetical protein
MHYWWLLVGGIRVYEYEYVSENYFPLIVQYKPVLSVITIIMSFQA